jgi:folate-binding protein YgfZ
MSTDASPETKPTLDAQYRALREEAGLAGPLERGLLAVSGRDGAEYLQGQLTNDIEALEPGSGCYAALLDRKGRMQADMRVIRTSADEILIETEPDRLDPVRRHLDMFKIGREVEIGDRSAATALLRLGGPASARALGDAPLGSEHACRPQRIAESDCLVVATDMGCDLLVPADRTAEVRDAILAAGAEPVGAEAIDILRVEAGRPRFGAEMGEGTMPQEAGINDRAIDFEKGCYIGQETVARLHYRGKPNRHLRRLRPEGEVSAGDEIALGERVVGTVGTAVLSPAEGPLALAILRREAEPGERVRIGAGVTAIVEELN